jgi:hypothetical protein
VTAPTTASGGGICPLCRWAQDHGHPHPCITNPNAQDVITELFTNSAADPIPLGITEALRTHPAAPLVDATLRPVHRTWCFCACSPLPATVEPGAARS